ncbi:gamma-glutamylcyclotransferase [Thalassobaculum sp.]|uniref:gamma-glutamylcyclotransferase n=1 Tax=Thalassobaculum sp. TaxID=2022740 RepID=UPI0032EBAE25
MKEADAGGGGDGAEEGDGGIWIFGYGSLMWNPGFPFVERANARLLGRHRRLCVVSRHHRGDAARPGLVMGLDRGGSCRGIAYRVPSAAVAGTLAYLHERETAHYPVYRRADLPVVLDGPTPRTVRSVTYVIDRTDPDYAGHLTVEQQAAIVAVAHGLSGANRDYLKSVVEHIHALGLRDRRLEAVLHALGDRP